MAKREHVSLVQSGVEALDRWHAENPETRLDLRWADFGGAHVDGASLIDADLAG